MKQEIMETNIPITPEKDPREWVGYNPLWISLQQEISS